MLNRPSESCFYEKLCHFMSFDEDERELLAALEQERISFADGHQVYGVGEEVSALYIVESGRVSTHSELADGRRQVFQLHYPGDIIGFSDVPFAEATVNAVARSETTLCPFPKTALATVFRDSPRIAALLFAIAMTEHTIVLDRVRCLGRMSAGERLAQFLMESIARLRITNEGMTDTFDSPVSQTVVGDMLGLTNVSVSRSLRQLETDGFIERDGARVRLRRMEDLAAMCEFKNRFGQLRADWFPA